MKLALLFILMPIWIVAQTKTVWVKSESTWTSEDTIRKGITIYYKNTCATCNQFTIDIDYEKKILDGTAYIHYNSNPALIKVRSWHYKSNIVFDGNSITAGTRATNGYSYPMQLSGWFTDSFDIFPVIINKAVAGQTLIGMNSDASTDIDPIYDATHHILVIMGGINDSYNR